MEYTWDGVANPGVKIRLGQFNRRPTGIDDVRKEGPVKYQKFRLWPITATLLREHARPTISPSDLLLVGENGLPLVHSELVDGKLKKTDVVRSTFTRLQNVTGINGHRGFYTLRKTGADEIEQINPLVTYMFLAQSERGVKKHYARPHWDALDAAVAELGQRLAMGEWAVNNGAE